VDTVLFAGKTAIHKHLIVVDMDGESVVEDADAISTAFPHPELAKKYIVVRQTHHVGLHAGGLDSDVEHTAGRINHRIAEDVTCDDAKVAISDERLIQPVH